MNFDMHSHFIAQEFVEAISKPGSAWQAKLVEKGEESWMVHDQGYTYPLSPGFYDTAARLADMARMKLDMAVVSVSPTLFYYWAEPKLALDVARMTNDAIYRLTKERPDKFVGMGTLPMQNVEAAITELRRSVRDLGFKSILIGSNVEGDQFDDPQFLRFFKECEALDVFIFFHPSCRKSLPVSWSGPIRRARSAPRASGNRRCCPRLQPLSTPFRMQSGFASGIYRQRRKRF